MFPVSLLGEWGSYAQRTSQQPSLNDAEFIGIRNECFDHDVREFDFGNFAQSSCVNQAHDTDSMSCCRRSRLNSR